MNQQDFPTEYCDAFRSVRAAKNLFWWLIAAAIVAQLAAFVLVNFVGVIDPLHQGGTSQPATAPLSAERWQEALTWVLPATKFLALVCGMLLSLTLLVAVNLSLLGRLGGVAGLVSAFFWSLILLALVTPWQQVMNAAVACGALYNLDELVRAAGKVKCSWGVKEAGALDWTLFYARFIAYPLVTVLVWLRVQAKFARGYRGMNLPRPAEMLPGQP